MYAFTDCEVSISPNACVIIEDKPRFMSVNDILKYNTEHTVNLLRKELEIRQQELEDDWHFSSLVKIFIEKRIYRNIEECTTWESVIDTIDAGLKPYKKKFRKAITRDDIVALTEIKIKRISRYDVKEQDEKIKGLEKQLEEVAYNLAHIRQYSINWYKDILKKFSKGRERKTRISSFEQVVASEVIINNQKLYVNRDDGFAGFSLKKDEFVSECSELDEIIVFRGDGTMITTKVDEKKYVGKDVRHISIYRKTDPEQVYNMIYQDGRGGNIMIKRFTVGGTTRDKEYILTKGNEGSKVLWFSAHAASDNAESVRVMLRPKPKLRITQIDVNFNEYEVKGRGTIGNILTRNSVSKVIKTSDAKPGVKVPDHVPGPVKPAKASTKVPVKKEILKPVPKKANPLREQTAVTVEWDFNQKKEKISKDRARILSELEKKVNAKKAQTKLDI